MSRPYQESLPSNALARFDKYGLPGLVICALFAANAALLYILFSSSIPALRDSTQAMTRVAIAMENLTQTIKENRWTPPKLGSISGSMSGIPSKINLSQPLLAQSSDGLFPVRNQ